MKRTPSQQAWFDARRQVGVWLTKRDFKVLQDMAEHPTRAWWVAGYEADADLPWRSVVRVARSESSPAP